MLSNLVVIVHDKSFKCYKMFGNLSYILMFICQKANCTIREEILNRMNIWTDYYASSYILAFTYTRVDLKSALRVGKTDMLSPVVPNY